jgi:hypothetical protein
MLPDLCRDVAGEGGAIIALLAWRRRKKSTASTQVTPQQRAFFQPSNMRSRRICVIFATLQDSLNPVTVPD